MDARQLHLLACLSEEAAEVAQEVGKAIRFGLDDLYDDTSPRNRLINELNDLLGVAEMLVTYDVLPQNWQSNIKQEQKRFKVHDYMNQYLGKRK